VNSFPTSLLILLGFLLAPVVAGFLASILCSLSILRHRKPPWLYALLSIALGIFSSLLVMFRGDALHPSRWHSKFYEQWDPLLMALTASIPCSIFVTIIVVTLFRERFKKHLSLEERRKLRRRLHEMSWLRMRWFNLIASSGLIACFTSLLISLYSSPVRFYDPAAKDGFSSANNRSPGSAAPTPSTAKETPAKPLLDLSEEAAFFSPFCLLGMLVSGGWLGFTLAYWRGYWKVRPRHRRHFPSRHHSLGHVH